jgi:hypothetical protein
MNACNEHSPTAVVIHDGRGSGCPWCEEVDMLQRRIESMKDMLYRMEIKIAALKEKKEK